MGSYKTLAINLVAFQEMNMLPYNIYVCRLNNGTGIENTLKSNSARWHKYCSNKNDQQKVEHANAKKRNEYDISKPCKNTEGLYNTKLW